jgi:integrase
MKAGKVHVVPLSEQAMAALQRAKDMQPDGV